MLEIRKATKKDARWIGSCHYHCWKETYQGLISDTYLNNLNEQKNEDRFEKMFDLIGEYQYIVLEDQTPIGFFDISKPRDDYAAYEVQGLYLRKGYHKKGYGKKIIHFIQQNTHNNFYLWCLKSNPTCHFYIHMGGKEIAQKEVNIGGRMETEVCFLFH